LSELWRSYLTNRVSLFCDKAIMLKKAKTKLNIIRVFFIISYNVLQICDGQDFYHKCLCGAQNFRLPLNCLRSTKPRLLQMCCYVLPFSFCRYELCYVFRPLVFIFCQIVFVSCVFINFQFLLSSQICKYFVNFCFTYFFVLLSIH